VTSGSRPSHPPVAPSAVAERLKTRLDAHEAAENKSSSLTDEQRLAVVREIWRFWVIDDKSTHLDAALGHYEEKVKARLQPASSAPSNLEKAAPQ
jgi:hypothetical protein